MAIGKQLCLALALLSAGCAANIVRAESGAGTYVADLPGASGCGRRMVLELFSDHSYVFVQRYLCKPWTPAQLQSGTWQVQGEALVLSGGGTEMRFSAGGGGLDYVGDRYGTAGLHLQRSP